MYSLKVKINNVWQDLDLGDDKPAMNYERNDINELKNRKADWSHKVKLPMSNNNIRIFGNIIHINVINDTPYKGIECRLYYDEYVLAGAGSVLHIIGVSNDKIDVQILSGVVDLFNQMNLADMSEIDLGVFKSKPFYFRQNGFTDFSIIALAWFQYGRGYSYQQIGNTLPFARFISVIDKILEKHGYRLDTNIRDNINDIVLPCVVPPKQPDNYAQYLIVKAENDVKLYNMNDVTTWKITQNLSGELTLNSSKKKVSWEASIKGLVNINLVMRYELYENRQERVDIPVTLSILKNGIPIYSNTAIREMTFNKKIPVKPGEIYEFSYTFDDSNLLHDKPFIYMPQLDAQLTISMIPQGIKGLSFAYLDVPIASSLGFDTQFDLIKAFVMSFGLFVDVDSTNKIMYANTFKKILDNKANAMDWTDKADIGNIEIEFHNKTFGQANKFAFEKNEKQGITDNATFAIKDAVLAREKDYAVLPFEAGTYLKSGYGNMPSIAIQIPLIKSDDDSSSYKVAAEATKPHLCRLGDRYSYDFGAGNFYYRRVEIVSAEDLKEYHKPFFDNVFKRYRKVSLQMLLTPEDVRKAMSGIPVFMRQYNSYFYVNSIKNYIVGQLSEVELLKI